MSTSSISRSFEQKKSRILRDLAVSPTDYNDASPKGSIDNGIRELIDFINSLDGYVTTSSCAGRVSIYAEGQKTQLTQEETSKQPSTSKRVKTGLATVGGKGGGGKWLFVSHDSVDWQLEDCGSLFKVGPITFLGYTSTKAVEPKNARFVRFAFEPMILHVMCASLYHARPLLSAAINAGFRESGVQSLKNLDDPEACPMVAIRTAGGLSMQSIIGLVETDENGVDRYCAFVPEMQLKLLLEVANARFEASARMPGNLENCLNAALEFEGRKSSKERRWEDPVARKTRKRQEGVAKSHLCKTTPVNTIVNTRYEDLSDNVIFSE